MIFMICKITQKLKQLPKANFYKLQNVLTC